MKRTLAFVLTLAAMQPAFASPKLDQDLARVLSLARANDNDKNDQAIDDVLNSMSSDEQVEFLERLGSAIGRQRRELQTLRTQLNATLLPTREQMREVRDHASLLASGATAMMGFVEYVQASSTINSFKILERMDYFKSEKKLAPYKDLMVVDPLTGNRKLSLRLVLKRQIARDMQVPFFNSRELEINGFKATGSAMLLGTSLAIAGEIAVAALPESAGDKDLEVNVDRLKADLDKLDLVYETLQLHLQITHQKFEIAKLKGQLNK